MGMAAPIYFTAEMVRALPDDGARYEVVRGELLVTPAPRLWHQEVLGRLSRALGNYLDAVPAVRLYCSPADISWAPDTLVQPDLFVIPLAQARTLDWAQVKDLLLVVEVLSPSSARHDRFTKRIEYQRQDIPLYWVVDLKAERVEVWTPTDTEPHLETERLRWLPPEAATPFILPLRDLFRPL